MCGFPHLFRASDLTCGAGQSAELSQLLGQRLKLQIFRRDIFYHPKSQCQWDRARLQAVTGETTCLILGCATTGIADG